MLVYRRLFIIYSCLFILTGAYSISEDPKSADVPSFVYYILLCVYFNRG